MRKIAIILFIATATAVLAGDISPGYTFSSRDTVTSTKLNNLVGSATITPSFISGKSVLTSLGGSETIVVNDAGTLKQTTLDNAFLQNPELITGLSEETMWTNDLFLFYSTSNTALQSINVTNIWREPRFISMQPEAGTVYSNSFVPVWSPSNNSISKVAVSNLLYSGVVSNFVWNTASNAAYTVAAPMTNYWLTNLGQVNLTAYEEYLIANPFGVTPRRTGAYLRIPDGNAVFNVPANCMVDISHVTNYKTNQGFSMAAGSAAIYLAHGNGLEMKSLLNGNYNDALVGNTWHLYVWIER
jgi:hypothetical protein